MAAARILTGLALMVVAALLYRAGLHVAFRKLWNVAVDVYNGADV